MAATTTCTHVFSDARARVFYKENKKVEIGMERERLGQAKSKSKNIKHDIDLMGGLRVRCGRCGHRLKFQIVSTRTFVIKSNIFSSIIFLFYRILQQID